MFINYRSYLSDGAECCFYFGFDGGICVLAVEQGMKQPMSDIS